MYCARCVVCIVQGVQCERLWDGFIVSLHRRGGAAVKGRGVTELNCSAVHCCAVQCSIPEQCTSAVQYSVLVPCSAIYCSAVERFTGGGAGAYTCKVFPD